MKTALLLGAVLLAGCAPEALPPPIAHSGPYTVGGSTEDELFAAKGPPVSRIVDDDGTRTDVYPAKMKFIDFRGGMRKEMDIPPADGNNLPEVKPLYVYSRDGILRHMRSDIVSKGADGQEHHQVSETPAAAILPQTAKDAS